MLGFKATKYDKDVFMHWSKEGSSYNYIWCQADELLIVAVNTQEILYSLMKVYKVSNPGSPIYHLECDYSMIIDDE